MSKIKKALFSPVVLIMVLALVVGVGVVTGQILPKASAQFAQLDCAENSEVPCQAPDVCGNIEEIQTEVPDGYHLDEKESCVVDSTPQVLGESTTVSDPAPQVLAETFGK